MPDELAFAYLLPVSTDRLVLGISRRQPHFLPDFKRRSRRSVTPVDVVLIGIQVMKVEADELQALVLKIDQCAVDAALVRAEIFGQPFVGGGEPGRVIPRSPVVGPVDPRRAAKLLGLVSAAATGGETLHLAQKTLAAR